MPHRTDDSCRAASGTREFGQSAGTDTQVPFPIFGEVLRAV